MSLSVSRQQFMSYETQTPEEIHYGRKGGVFLSTKTCVALLILAVIAAAAIGTVVYYITSSTLTTTSTESWDDSQPFGGATESTVNLRLPNTTVPTYYRLKLKPNLNNSTFTGEVAITIKTRKKVKEIVLHAKNLQIIDAKLTEQVYGKVDTYPDRVKRAVEETTIDPSNLNTTNVADSLTMSASTVKDTEGSEETPSVNKNEATTSSTITSSSVEAVSSESINKETETPIKNTTDIHSQSSSREDVETKNDNSTDSPMKVSLLNTITEKAIKDTDTTKDITYLDTLGVDIPKAIDRELTVSKVKVIKISSISMESGDRLVIQLFNALSPNVDYTLELAFEGNISDSLDGFYKSSYTNNDNEVRELAVTQFEPTSARSAFPCFDEPHFKAKFEISIAHPKNLSALSNMKMSSQEDMAENPQWVWSHFDRSVEMSTYLVAYVISDFQHRETSYRSLDNTTKPIRVWSRPDLLHKMDYALSIAPKLLEYFESLYGLPYALDKMDIVAVPDFANGAMENWGLVTFTENALLYSPVEGSPREKRNVAVCMAHELGHQWFGNLVTMSWWRDLWLNEGFATYVEYVAVDKIEPSWNMLEAFTTDKLDLLHSDSRKNTQPISLHIADASEITQKFDDISYLKAAAIIRMLNRTISEELFKKGLKLYLQQWKLKNAAENDLWSSMSQAIAAEPRLRDLSMVEYMNSWTRQAGYPLVHVLRDYATGNVTLQQQLFTTSASPYDKMVNQLWKIPITYQVMNGSQRSSVQDTWLHDRSMYLTVNASESDALYVNVDAIGYYRVNYDLKNWQALSVAVKKSHVPVITKAQLIDDAFELATVGSLDYEYAIGLTTFLVDGDDSKVVWDVVHDNLLPLRIRLRTLPAYVQLQEYVQILIKKQLEKLNYGLNPLKDDNEALLIEILLSWECSMESKRCIDWARSEFDKWTTRTNLTDNPIPSHLRPLVYNTVLYYGGTSEFQFLWQHFWNTTEPAVKSLVIGCLTSTRDESLINMLLEKSLTEIPKQYAPSAWIYETTIGSKLAQQFMYDNWDRFYERFGQDDFALRNVVQGAFGMISTKTELDTLKQFALRNSVQFQRMSQTVQKIVDVASVRVRWGQQYAGKVDAALRRFIHAYKNGTLDTYNTIKEPNNEVTNFNTSTETNKTDISVSENKNTTTRERMSDSSIETLEDNKNTTIKKTENSTPSPIMVNNSTTASSNLTNNSTPSTISNEYEANSVETDTSKSLGNGTESTKSGEIVTVPSDSQAVA